MPITGTSFYDVYVVITATLVILGTAGCAAGAWAIVRARRRSLHRRILRAFDPCLRCGFELRATTGPCPKCGAARPVIRQEEAKTSTKNDNALFDDFEDEPWHVT